MKILVLGATGATGMEVVEQAINQGHEVIAYVRSREKFMRLVSPVVDHLSVIEGELWDKEKLLGALESVRQGGAVISALGHTHLKKSSMLAEAMGVVIPLMQQKGVMRLIYESALGTGDTHQTLPWFFRVIMKRLFLKHVYQDHEAAEGIIRKSPLNFTIVLPGRLTNGPKTGRYQARERFPRLMTRKDPHISRADVADFMIRQVNDSTFSRMTVGLIY